MIGKIRVMDILWLHAEVIEQVRIVKSIGKQWRKTCKRSIITIRNQYVINNRQIIKHIKELYRFDCPVRCACRLHRLHQCRRITPSPHECQDMTLNNLMAWFQWCWSSGECGAPLHCHCFHVHSSPEWYHLIEHPFIAIAPRFTLAQNSSIW